MTQILKDRITRLALALFDAGAFLDKTRSPGGKGFKLKLHEKNPNAPLSPFYLNLRTPENPKPGPLTPELVSAIGSAMFQLVEEQCIAYNVVAGVPRAGEPFAEAFHLAAKQSYLQVRVLQFGKVETEGERHVGALSTLWSDIGNAALMGNRLLLVDDLITAADTKMEAFESALGAGFVVHDVVVLLDREQGGRNVLERRGIRVWPCYTIRSLLDLYVEHGKIAPTLRAEMLGYLAAA